LQNSESLQMCLSVFPLNRWWHFFSQHGWSFLKLYHASYCVVSWKVSRCLLELPVIWRHWNYN